MITNMYPYLAMDGNAQEAIHFYEKVLNAKVLNIQTFGQMPPNPDMPIPEDAENRVLNAHLKIGEVDLMLSDTFPGQPLQLGMQTSIALILDDVEQTKQIFDQLSDGGNVSMPIQETFWSPAYGSVTDKFGISWQVSADAAK
ncbi:VOC family protein [Gracilibacillus oryzae]|uniref:VOC family protein n=1 Tax=Gracilibacillus oryzae TaxID=1672701 RepID=A0A7C8KY57_9BACI|nr:VOC family protein [Gracilibacillus oryzae]KAB8139352.1 VOC family protein [Gracilibacillus oryzae]